MRLTEDAEDGAAIGEATAERSGQRGDGVAVLATVAGEDIEDGQTWGDHA